MSHATASAKRARQKARADPLQESARRGPTGSAASAARPRRQRILENLILALASGILVAGPFLFPGLAWLHYVALLPWAILLTREGRDRDVLLPFVLGAFTYSFMVWGPFSITHVATPFLIALVYAPWVIPFGVIVRFVHRRLPGVPLTILVPSAWITSEWLRLQFSVGRVGLFPLGSSQFQLTRLIQIADFAGVAGVSFVVAAASGAIADLWLLRRQREWRRSRVAGAATYPVLLLATVLYGEARAGMQAFTVGPRLAIIQPNLRHFHHAAAAKQVFERQLAFTRAEVPRGSADLIVWPENAIDAIFADDSVYVRGLQDLAQEKQAQILTGTRAWAGRPAMYTSALQLSVSGALVGAYHKLYLIPWAEYMPFQRWLPLVSGALDRAHTRLTRRILGFRSVGVPGADVVLFSLTKGGRTFRYATPICFEITSGEFGRRAAVAGADFFVNLTSEGVLGPAVYTHTWALSTLRAVENRVGVVRVGNNGISGIIDPNGRTRAVLRGKHEGRTYLEEGTLIAPVLVDDFRESFFARHGDVFSYLCITFSAVLLALASRAGRLASRRSSSVSAAGT